MITATFGVPAAARGALAAEWIKLRTVRSTYIALAAGALAAIALGYMVVHYVVNNTPTWAAMSPSMKATWDPVSYSLGGLSIAQLAFGVLGVLAISSEHATGLVRTTYAAIPRRRAVLGAKGFIVAAVTLATGEAVAFTAYFIGQHVLSAKNLNAALSEPAVLRSVFDAGLYLALVALLGLGLGSIIRHTAGAIAALFVVAFLIPQVIHAMPDPWDIRIGRFMLQLAGQQMCAMHRAPGFLSPGLSLIVCLAYPAAVLAAAAFIVTRRDA